MPIGSPRTNVSRVLSFHILKKKWQLIAWKESGLTQNICMIYNAQGFSACHVRKALSRETSKGLRSVCIMISRVLLHTWEEEAGGNKEQLREKIAQFSQEPLLHTRKKEPREQENIQAKHLHISDKGSYRHPWVPQNRSMLLSTAPSPFCA
jgi:hypothetical protein